MSRNKIKFGASNTEPLRVARRVKDVVYGTRLYAPTRRMYLLLFNHEHLRFEASMKRFYGQFFRQGDMVFDIGANVGKYSEMFSSLGATVVAVEPNPSCCKILLRLSCMTRSVHVESCAVGALPGNARLRICNHDELSTLSDEWYERSKVSTTYRDVQWIGHIEVPVVTVDDLVRFHGVPAFVKIDVEGYEENVIAGMSCNPKFVSFEFSDVRREVALNCIRQLGKRGYGFNVMLGKEFTFQFSDWKENTEAIEWLKSYRGKEEFGDVFAMYLGSR